MVREHALKGFTRSLQSPWIVACCVLLLGIAASYKAGQLDTDRQLSDARSQVIQELATLRARMEGVVNTVFSATSGLTDVIAYQGEISEELFAALARQAIKGHPQIRNIAAAPDNVITLLYPLEGNGQVLGLHYSTLPEQYTAVQQAMQSGSRVFSGPHNLVQGGRGLIARVPVFTGRGQPEGATPRYWGVVSVVTNIDALLDRGGINDSSTLDIGLRRIEEQGDTGPVIWGEDVLFTQDPVRMYLSVPGGRWQLAAIPKNGWPKLMAAYSPFFIAGVVNSILIAAFIGWLVALPRQERSRNEGLRREMSERRRAEEELRLSEQKYATIFQLMPDMVGITRMADGTFLEVNNGFLAISGWTREEVIGRTSLELGLWSAEARAVALAIVQEKGVLENYSFSLAIKSGEKRHGLMFLAPITVKGEQCLYFMVRDLTELKQAQAILETERTRLRNLLQTIPALVWMKDPDGVYIFCNARFERFFDAKEDMIIGRTDYDFLEKELADFFRGYDRKAAASGQPSINEEWITYADDGHRELLETIKTPIYDGSGQLLGVLGIAWDITEKKRIEEELRNERTRFVNLVDSVDGIVWEANAATFTFTYVSKEAERLLGYPVEAWHGERFWWQHLHPEDRERVYEQSRACTNRGEEHELEYRFFAQDGRVIWIQDYVTVVSEDGKPRWRRGIMVDITAKKEEEKERKRLEHQLRQAQRIEAVGRLAGGVAHDFNNKLSVILGYAELLKHSILTEDRIRSYLSQVILAATQSRDITRQLLAFSRQEVISPQVLDVNSVVTSVRKGLGRLIREDIQFEVRLDPGLWLIHMDPSQVDQLIMNLVVNARDAMENGGRLVIETRNVHLDTAFVRDYPELKAGPYIQLTVSDTGCGISAETRQHIFEPFYTTKETGKGTGLGLATVYGIVTQNRGMVLVESEPGAGATFKVFLPRCGEEVGEETEESSLPVRQTVTAATILLVEDEESVRQMTQDMLEERGYQVLVAASPQEALELSAKSDLSIDLLLTDVIMPGMNGRELSRLIVQACPGIKVLFMSGYAADILPQEGTDAETYFLKKPFTMHALLAAIEQRLGEESKGI